jgi:hypothetical protein
LRVHTNVTKTTLLILLLIFLGSISILLVIGMPSQYRHYSLPLITMQGASAFLPSRSHFVVTRRRSHAPATASRLLFAPLERSGVSTIQTRLFYSNSTDARSSFHNKNDETHNHNVAAENLKSRLSQLTQGQHRDINLSSPKQVSQILFGNKQQRTSRATLQEFIQNTSSGEEGGGQTKTSSSDDLKVLLPLEARKEIAQLVLEWRALTKNNNNKCSAASITTTTSLPSATITNNINNSIDRASRTNLRPRQRPAHQNQQQSRSLASLASSSSRGSNEDDHGDAMIGGVNGSAGDGEEHEVLMGEQESSSHQSSSQTTQSLQSQYSEFINGLFASNEENNQMDESWKDVLLNRIDRPSAKQLVYQLNSELCPMGYDPNATPAAAIHMGMTTTTTALSSSMQGKKGSLLAFVREQKARHSNCVALTRVGDFYETYGLDAILLIQFCGLNPMGNKCKAGCPIRNVQNTLDDLTAQGFHVAVLEEGTAPTSTADATDNDKSSKPKAKSAKPRLKHRFLAQIVSPASPTYLFDLVLGTSNADTLSSHVESRNHVGLIHTAAGYTLVEVNWECRTVRVSERSTQDAVACRLAAYPPVEPLLYTPTPTEYDTIRRQGSHGRALSWLSRGGMVGNSTTYGGSDRRYPATKILSPHLMEEAGSSSSSSSPLSPSSSSYCDIQRSKKHVVNAILQLMDQGTIISSSGDSNRETNADADEITSLSLSHNDFQLVATSAAAAGAGADDAEETITTQTQPLHKETALQLGLLDNNPSIPPLISAVLPLAAPAATRHFLKKWLLVPPPPSVADSMSEVVHFVKSQPTATLPPLQTPPLGKIISLVRAGQASAQVFCELAETLETTICVLEDPSLIQNGFGLVAPLLQMVEYESGVPADPESLRKQCQATLDAISQVVRLPPSPSRHHSHHHHHFDANMNNLDTVSHVADNCLPRAFLERNEVTWRGRVQRQVATKAYTRVEEAATALAQAVEEDFLGMDHGGDDSPAVAVSAEKLIVQDIFNNMIALRDIPDWAKEDSNLVLSEEQSQSKFYHPRDRNGKLLKNRYTTERVSDALSNYVEACQEACEEVTEALKRLSETMCEKDPKSHHNYMSTIMQASMANLILSTVVHHAIHANTQGWNIATVRDGDANEAPLSSSHNTGSSNTAVTAHFSNLWPYWMDRSESVSNTFDLNGLFLLTAPNMSGKSTLMRATAAAALLSACGLCAPLASESWLQRFDCLFVRGASADVPSEGKSAFGAEMGDVASLLRSASSKSLVFVDELGRGTSPRDGTSLAGAVLEEMALRELSGVFATHLHGILDLPLLEKARERLVNKRMMTINEEEDFTSNVPSMFGWTYKLEDGICTDSLAMKTAERFGLPPHVISRAKDFSSHYNTVNNGTASYGKDNNDALVYASNRLANNGKSLSKSVEQEILALPLEPFHILEQMTNSAGTACRIPSGYMSPPVIDQGPCVYILEYTHTYNIISSSSTATTSRSEEKRYYVGETRKLSQRLKQHRNGKRGPHFVAYAAPTESKDQARNIESRLIRTLCQRGCHMLSVNDGTTISGLGSKQQ